MRSYNSLNRKRINISVKQSNILSNAFQKQYLGNGVSMSSDSNGNINLSNYALISYVDASINAVYANFATGTSSYTKPYIDASFNAVYTKSYIDASFKRRLCLHKIPRLVWCCD